VIYFSVVNNYISCNVVTKTVLDFKLTRIIILLKYGLVLDQRIFMGSDVILAKTFFVSTS
jgi:hypothetical protein